MDRNEVAIIIRALLSSRGSSCTIQRLISDFRNETGYDIPLFEYSNVSDFLHSIPDTVKLTGIYPLEEVSLVVSEKSAHIMSLVQHQKNNVKKKIFSHKSNLKEVATDARINEPQRSQTHLAKITFEYEMKESIAYQVTAETPAEVSSEKSDFCLAKHVATKNNIFFINVSFHARVGEYIEVCPCRILNPHKFYFRFRKFQKKFRTIMNKLQHFYSTYKNFPNVPDEIIRHKFVCAAFYKIYGEPMWHRVVIYKTVGDSHVIVNFVDYGHMSKIPKKNLKYLHEEFHSLPRQAVLGSLANIRPSKGSSDWSPEAIERFADLALEKDLIAGVVHIDAQACFMEMALSCTQGSEIHINDTLVSEDYADFTISTKKTAEVSKRTDSVEAPKVNIGEGSFRNEGYEEFYTELDDRFSVFDEAEFSISLTESSFGSLENNLNSESDKSSFDFEEVTLSAHSDECSPPFRKVYK